MAGKMVRNRKHAFNRCASRTTALADHPATVYLREDVLLSAPNGWIGELFLPENVDATVATLVGSQPDSGPAANIEAAKAGRADADQRIRRFPAAIAVGVDPASMVDVINQAQPERTAAQAEIDNTQTRGAALGVAEI
jgi:hypothetical protein